MSPARPSGDEASPPATPGDFADRAASAVAFAAVGVVLAYALLRLAERVAFRQPNPAIVLWAERSAFGWRVALAVYLGLLGAPLGHALAREGRERASLWLGRAAALAGVALGLQLALAP